MKKGFTLIELVFVLLLLGLFGNFVIPKISSIMGLTVKNSATELSGYLQMAYERSVLRHERLRIRFDFQKQKYWTEKFEEVSPIPLLDENTKIDDALAVFQKREEEFQLSEEEREKKEQEKYKKIIDRDLNTRSLPDGVAIQSIRFPQMKEKKEEKNLSPWIDFLPSGFSTEVSITLTNERGDLYTITLPPLGGRSKIEKGEPA